MKITKNNLVKIVKEEYEKFKKIQALKEEKRLIEQQLHETGEWVWDEDQTAWANSLEEDVNAIIDATDGKVELKGVYGFDNYQGPYASVNINGRHYNIWTSGNDLLWIEDYIVDNTSEEGMNPGFMGSIDHIIDIINNGQQNIEEIFSDNDQERGLPLIGDLEKDINNISESDSEVEEEGIGLGVSQVMKRSIPRRLQDVPGRSESENLEEESDLPKMDITSMIIDYESGTLEAQQIIELFSELVKSGMAWTLQGHYGRTAASLIDNGILDKDGNILKNAEELDESSGIGISQVMKRSVPRRRFDVPGRPDYKETPGLNESEIRKFVRNSLKEYYKKSYSTYGQKGDPRIITLRYDTKCSETGKPLKAGEQAVYYPSSKSFFGLDTKQADEFRSWKADMDMGFDY